MKRGNYQNVTETWNEQILLQKSQWSLATNLPFVKVKNKKTGVVKVVKKVLASDFIGTGEWVLVEKEIAKQEKPKFDFNKEDK